MTDEQINTKIAEARDWKRVPEVLGQGLWFCPPEPGIKLRGIRSSCPDYCNDLNAMHEAEEVLDKTGNGWSDYADRLEQVAGTDGWGITSPMDKFRRIFHATARQRAEALLRTLNLWEE